MNGFVQRGPTLTASITIEIYVKYSLLLKHCTSRGQVAKIAR